MNEYNKSNYALNKVRKGIAYRNADGSIIEVTFEKIAKENPEFTKEDFEMLKQLSDRLYHDEAKSDWNYHYHVTDDLDESRIGKRLSSLSLEDELTARDDEAAFNKRLRESINTLLTPTQKRRFILHRFRGMTYREIAELENVSAMSVCESIQAAQKKIKKFLRNF